MFAIRIAAPADATAISEVVRRSISECCHVDHHGDPELIAAWLENKTPGNILDWLRAAHATALVAVRGGQVLGFALANTDELALLYVVPEALYQGVGKALLRAVESCFISRGVTTLRLESTRAARDFYLRNSFTISGPVQVWAGMEGLPMMKLLVSHSVDSVER